MISKPNIPEDWRTVRLGEVVRFQQGWNALQSSPKVLGRSHPVRNWGRPERHSYHSRRCPFVLDKRGVAFGGYGDLRKRCVAVGNENSSRLVGIAGELMGASQDITLLAPTEEADRSYLCRTLINNAGALQQRSRGTTIQGVSREDVDSLPILLPPLREQRAIAAVLDTIDDAIERTEAVIEATEQLRDSLLHELLTRGVPGWHSEWKNVPGLGAIPADWEVVRLGEVAEVQTGRAVNRKAAHGHILEIPYLSVANVKDGYLDLGTVKTMQVDGSEVDRYRLLAGDVLFTEGGDADKLGRGTVWKEEIPLCLHQNHIFVVRPDLHFLCAEFLSFYATSSFGKRYFLGAAKQTTNLASINSTQLRQMPLPLPSVREQEELVALLSAVGVFAQQASNEHDSLQSLKNSTANALLAGRLRVGLSSTGTTPPGQAEAGVLADG